MMSAYGQKAIEYVTKFTDKNLYINSGGASAADLDFDEPDDTGYRSLEEVLSAKASPESAQPGFQVDMSSLCSMFHRRPRMDPLVHIM